MLIQLCSFLDFSQHKAKGEQREKGEERKPQGCFTHRLMQSVLFSLSTHYKDVVFLRGVALCIQSEVRGLGSCSSQTKEIKRAIFF